MILTHDYWDDVRVVLEEDPVALAYDGCHKIYILMDDEQVVQFNDYEYEYVVEVTDVEQALTLLHQWYDEACFLRFIQAVTTNHDDPNKGYISLIPQGAEE